mgnify:CR=1 FL=1
MHFKWLSWLDDVNKCCEADGKENSILERCAKLKDLKIEIIHLKYLTKNSYIRYCKDYQALMSRVKEYEETDLELAYLDGRAKKVKAKEPKKQPKKKEKEKKAIDLVKGFSLEERKALIEMLENMED